MSEKQPLAEALRSEIVKLATDGDLKNDNALTADVLLRVMRVAKTGRDLLVSLNASPTNLAGMIRRPSPFGLGPLGVESMEGDADGSVMATPYSTALPSENFGMTAIREMIAAAKNLNGSNSPAKLVEALVIAREKGLDDVARELEEQLGIKKPTPALPKLETTISAGDGVTKTVVQEEKS